MKVLLVFHLMLLMQQIVIAIPDEDHRNNEGTKRSLHPPLNHHGEESNTGEKSGSDSSGGLEGNSDGGKSTEGGNNENEIGWGVLPSAIRLTGICVLSGSSLGAALGAMYIGSRKRNPADISFDEHNLFGIIKRRIGLFSEFAGYNCREDEMADSVQNAASRMNRNMNIDDSSGFDYRMA